MTRESLIARLAEIQKELIDTAPDDFGRRFELQSERDRVRSEMATLEPLADPDESRPSEELRVELESLRRTVKGMRRQDVDMVAQAGSGREAGWHGVHGDFSAINHAIGQATGRAELEARISRLEGILADRDNQA